MIHYRATILFLIPALGLMTAAPAIATCDDAIANKVYRCSVKRSDADQFADCYRFRRPATASQNFDLTPDVFGAALACGCTVKGKFKSVKFGAGAEFQCVSAASAGVGLLLRGKPKGNGSKIVKGQGVNEDGFLFAFECVEDATCSIAAVQQAKVVGNYR